MWDLVEQNCIQTIEIDYPSIALSGKIVEWGRNSIYPGPQRSLNEIKSNETKKEASNCFDMSDISEKTALCDPIIEP